MNKKHVKCYNKDTKAMQGQRKQTAKHEIIKISKK